MSNTILKLGNMWRKGYNYSHQNLVTPAIPMIQNIESTNACGMRCVMCPRNEMKRKVGFMDLALFESILMQLKENSRLCLHHFGDPLLHPKIGEMFRLCGEYGIKSSISTNPQTLTERKIKDIFDGGLDILHLSFDGAKKETFEKIRAGEANFEKSIEGIERFVKEKKRRGSLKPYTKIAIIKMKDTQDEIEAFKERWESYDGIDKVEVKEFITWDGTNEDINNMGVEESHKVKRKKYYPCLWPWMKLTVLWDGQVVACCFDSDAKCVLGNLKTQTLEEIWNGEEMQKFREQHIKNDFPDGHLCKHCREREGFVPSKMFPLNLIWEKRLNLLKYYKYN
jgi:radical SAM protein with 4Fe4S-binding SPASM domain